MRTAPHGVRYSINDLRSSVANEAEDDGAVPFEL
jgi:hypothetical protein